MVDHRRRCGYGNAPPEETPGIHRRVGSITVDVWPGGAGQLRNSSINIFVRPGPGVSIGSQLIRSSIPAEQSRGRLGHLIAVAAEGGGVNQMELDLFIAATSLVHASAVVTTAHDVHSNSALTSRNAPDDRRADTAQTGDADFSSLPQLPLC